MNKLNFDIHLKEAKENTNIKLNLKDRYIIIY